MVSHLINNTVVQGALDLVHMLAFTRYCYCQYCVVYIAIAGGRGGTLYCAIVWATTGGGRVSKEKVGGQAIALVRAKNPRNKTISCIGQSVRGRLGGPAHMVSHLKTNT